MVQSNSSCALKAFSVPSPGRKPRLTLICREPWSTTQRCKQQLNSQGCSESATPQDWGVFLMHWEWSLAMSAFLGASLETRGEKVLYFM